MCLIAQQLHMYATMVNGITKHANLYKQLNNWIQLNTYDNVSIEILNLDKTQLLNTVYHLFSPARFSIEEVQHQRLTQNFEQSRMASFRVENRVSLVPQK